MFYKIVKPENYSKHPEYPYWNSGMDKYIGQIIPEHCLIRIGKKREDICELIFYRDYFFPIVAFIPMQKIRLEE